MDGAFNLKKIEAIQIDTKSAVSAIGEIGQIIGKINEISMTIAGAVEEQAATTTEFSRNLAEAARDHNTQLRYYLT